MMELQTAKKACVEAGKIAMNYFQKDFSMKYKAPRNIVTQADVECEKRIRKIISAEYPSHGFVGEEEGSHGDMKNFWVVDPIDGTTNFSHGVDQFCHSVALVKSGKIVCGAVYNPVHKKLYTAYAGKGAWLNGNRIRVSAVADLGESLLISGFPYDAPVLEQKTYKSIASLRGKCHDIRRFGSAALDFCYVAQGVCDGFFEYKLNSWDVAAALLIVREAGGEVTDINGKEATIESGHFLASNGLLHGELLSYLERV